MRKLSAVCFLALATFGSIAEAQDATSKETAKKSSEVVVKLLEPGANPRKLLRFTPKKGDKQSTVMTMKMAQSMVMRGQKLPPVPTPAMKFAIDLAVTDVASNGDVTFEFTYPDAKVVDEEGTASAAKAAMEGMLKSMIGLKGKGVITSRGFTQSSDVELPPGAAPQLTAVIDSMKESLSKMSSPVPEEPIGVGAKWSVSQSITANGITLEQVSVHTVKAINGDKFDLAVEVTQKADKQEMKAPGLPEGAKMTLESLESNGKGTMLMNPTELFPVSEVKTETKSTMELDIGGQAQPMQLEMTIDMNIAPPKPAK